jgi:tetratricopeptide (TPR) repeat protein
MGQFPEAIESLNQAIKLQPDMAKAYGELGYANRNLKKYPEALAAYNQLTQFHFPAYWATAVVEYMKFRRQASIL